MSVMTSTAPADTNTRDIAPVAGIRFTVASRPQRRLSKIDTVQNLLSGTSFQPIPLPATGWVRKVALFFTATAAFASAGAITTGDGPFNLIAGVNLADATGQPIFQPISGFNLYLVNKYFSTGVIATNINRAYENPQLSPEFNYAATGTAGTATFRLDLDLELDVNSGYGCIPNLDSNAALQLKIDVAPYTVAFSGTGATAASVSVRVDQHYWAPVGSMLGGQPVVTNPVGFGDYVETRYETQVATASAENTIAVSNRGGLVQGIIVVSRAAGVRTAFTAGANVGLILDNNAIDEGITLEAQYDLLRRGYGFFGADQVTYAPVASGVQVGLDRGVQIYNFDMLSGGRDSWLSTRVGSLLQLKLTPGAGATQIELITRLAQVRDPAAFYQSSALD